MNDLIIKLRLLAKAEALLVRLHFRRAVRQVSLVLAAALFGLLALAMLNVALYLVFSPRVGPAPAAFAVAGLDLLIGLVATAAAVRMELGPEAVAVEALRDRVSDEIAADAERLRAQFDDLGQDIKRIRSIMTGIAHPGGIDLPVVFQWLMMLVGFLRRKRT